MNSASDARVKLRSLLLTALMRVPSTANSSRPNRSNCLHSSTNWRNTGRKALRLSRRKSAMVLKSGLRCRNSQITSILRWVSASRRRLERTRFRYPVQVTVDVQLQQIRRSIARTTRRLRNRADKPKRREVRSVDKGLDEPHRVIGSDIIVNRLR